VASDHLHLVAKNGSVLELACGTGILTRVLRTRLRSTVKLIATDLNEPMFRHAAVIVTRRAWQNHTWIICSPPCRTFAPTAWNKVSTSIVAYRNDM